jgi:hypothetical protein
MESPTVNLNGPTIDLRHAWQEPKIVLERQLLVSAQDGGTGSGSRSMPGAPVAPGFIGPLGTSGNTGNCL